MNNLKKFNELVIDQFKYGGVKYAKNQEKESTDVLFENHSHRWLAGTIDKYTHRYKNLARERDILKIATYMYITWLKRGFHLDDRGTIEVINTTVSVKEANFSEFMTRIELFELAPDELPAPPMSLISNAMCSWSLQRFSEITEYEILQVYVLAFVEWNIMFSHKAGADTDTYNESKVNTTK